MCTGSTDVVEGICESGVMMVRSNTILTLSGNILLNKLVFSDSFS